MIHFSAEFSSKTKADFNNLSCDVIKVTPAWPHPLVREGQNIHMPKSPDSHHTTISLQGQNWFTRNNIPLS